MNHHDSPGYTCPFCHTKIPPAHRKDPFLCLHCGKRMCNICLGMGVLGGVTSTNSGTCGICKGEGHRPELIPAEPTP